MKNGIKEDLQILFAVVFGVLLSIPGAMFYAFFPKKNKQ